MQSQLNDKNFSSAQDTKKSGIICSFSEFVEQLLCVRHCSRCWEYLGRVNGWRWSKMHSECVSGACSILWLIRGLREQCWGSVNWSTAPSHRWPSPGQVNHLRMSALASCEGGALEVLGTFILGTSESIVWTHVSSSVSYFPSTWKWLEFSSIWGFLPTSDPERLRKLQSKFSNSVRQSYTAANLLSLHRVSLAHGKAQRQPELEGPACTWNAQLHKWRWPSLPDETTLNPQRLCWARDPGRKDSDM